MGKLDNNKTSHAIMPMPLRFGIGIWMCIVILWVFLKVPPAKDFASPDAARIVVFHVPCATLAVVAFIVSAIYAISYLAGGKLESDIKSSVAASLGLLFTLLATVTGMMFAAVQWGSAWNWDPRETSILILLMVYLAYFSLRSVLPGGVIRARISAAYNLLACVAMPYLVFVMPRIMSGLHPTDTLTDRHGLSAEYRIALLMAVAAYAGLFVWLFRLHVRVAECAEYKRRKRLEQ